MGHHRRTLERGAPGVLARGKAPLKVWPIHVPLRVGGDGLTLQATERAVSRDAAPTWGGRPISKWTRWGVWNEDGTIFTPTRVI